jgi:hypothetical protein
MHVHVRELAAKQDDLVAAWQLMAAGWTRGMVQHRVARDGWRRVHAGVFAVNQAPLSQRQRWVAAVLSAPGTFLATWSSGTCWGFVERNAGYETVVRVGSGGRRRIGSLLVSQSKTLSGCTTRHEGLPIVTAARTLIDLAPQLGAKQLGRAFRESARLKLHTVDELSRVLRAHRGYRGIAPLVALCDRYATIPYHRCRSDAECLALEILHDAGIPKPEVNVDVAGREADLTWRERMLIVELDGPQWHLFREQDAEKERRWRSAGFTVRRLPTDDVYDRPERLLVRVRSQN